MFQSVFLTLEDNFSRGCGYSPSEENLQQRVSNSQEEHIVVTFSIKWFVGIQDYVPVL